MFAALSASPAMRLAATIAGMLTIGVGAALANPQMGNVVLALAPPAQAGMASAVTMIVRQAGFAISIAALGATLGTTDVAAAFAIPFTLAAFVALVAMVPPWFCFRQSPRKTLRQIRPPGSEACASQGHVTVSRETPDLNPGSEIDIELNSIQLLNRR